MREPGAQDLQAVLKAALAIASEPELGRLLGVALPPIIEHAGAQRGCLLLPRDGHWVVAAQGELGAPSVATPPPMEAEASGLVAASVVGFVAHTRERVALDDAANAGKFRDDAHVQQHGIRSLLCAPLLSHDELVGILYLENNLVAGAFARFVRDRDDLLEMLMSQAATSLEHAQSVETLREREAKYRRIVDTASEGIVALGTDDRITFVNDRMASMLGYAQDEMLGRRVPDFMAEADVPDHRQRLATLRQGSAVQFERRFLTKDGRAVWMLTSATPIRDESGSYLGCSASYTDITERNRAVKALAAERNMFVSGPTVVFKWGAAEGWPIEYVSPNVESQFGYKPEDLTTNTVKYAEIVHPDDLERIVAETAAATVQGAPSFQLLYRIARKDGEYRWVNEYTTVLRVRDGVATEYLGYIVDVTERKLAEEALRRSNRELRALSRCSELLIRAVDERALLGDICRIVCDEAGYRFAWVGYAQDADAKTVRPVAWAGIEDGELASAGVVAEAGRGPTGRAIRTGKAVAIADVATAPEVASWRERVLAMGYRSSVALPLKDGHGVTFGALCIYSTEPGTFTVSEMRLLEELAGELAFGIGVLRDRIERKRAEQTAALMGFALNNVREAAFLIDRTAHFHYVNDEACRVLGYARDELLGQTLADVDPDMSESRWSGHWEEVRTRGSLIYEGRYRAKDGRLLPVEINDSYLEYDGQGYHLALVRNIADRKQAELEREQLLDDVRQQRRRLEVVLDTAPVGISLYLTPEGPPALNNRAAETIMGRRAGPPMSLAERATYYGLRLPDGEPYPPEQLPLGRSLRGETLTGVEVLVRQPSGREVRILENTAPIRDAEGRVVGAVLAFQDITPIREQERLRDEFITAAAHELKTPVTTIRGYAQMLQRLTPKGREEHDAHALEVINAQTHRINRRVEEMLQVIRFRTEAATLVPSRFDLGELVAQVVARMRTVSAVHRVSLAGDAPVPVEGDRERVDEVLVSLLENGIELSPGGGEIEVRVWASQDEGLVSIRDHGVGIAPERQPHAFEPFYEVVPSGARGYRSTVSLGRYLSKLTIERHHGRIWVESEEGVGSSFAFALPLAQAREDHEVPPAQP